MHVSSKPFQIVQSNVFGTGLEVSRKGIARLSEIEKPISLLPVVGEFHSGKSTLLNSLGKVITNFVLLSKVYCRSRDIFPACRVTQLKISTSEDKSHREQKVFGHLKPIGRPRKEKLLF